MAKVNKAKNKKIENGDALWIFGFIVAIIPFIVQLKVMNLSSHLDYYYNWDGSDVYGDFFSYYKSWMIIIFAILSLYSVYIKSTEEFISDYIKKELYIKLMGLFTFFILLSFVFSKYKYVAFFGFVDRFEGTVVWISYIIIMFTASIYLDSRAKVDYVLKALVYSSIVMSIIGFTQYKNINIFNFEPLKSLVTLGVTGNPEIQAWKNIAYGTLYNPNYVGSYTAITIPVALYMSINKYQSNIVRGISVLAIIFNMIFLLLSKSTAGIVGVIAEFVIIGFVLFLKSSKKRKLIIGAVSIVLILICIPIFKSTVYYEKMETVFQVHEIKEEESYIRVYRLIDDKTAEINLGGLYYKIKVEGMGIKLFDENENSIDFSYDSSRAEIIPKSELYKPIQIFFYKKDKDVNILKFVWNGNYNNNFSFGINKERIYMAGNVGQEIQEDKVENPLFKGRERMGSNRGYIWGRSIPIMLKENIILGAGADTFTLRFPQNEFKIKKVIYGTVLMVTDKAHNMYIQMGMAFGLTGVSAFILIVVNIIRLFLKKFKNLGASIKHVVLLSSLIGYLIVGVFNDTLVSVTPIFFLILGMMHAIERKGVE